MSQNETLIGILRKFLDEEGFIPRSVSQLKEILKEDKVAQYNKLWDEKTKKKNIHTTRDFYEFMSQKVGDLILDDLIAAQFREEKEFYLENIVTKKYVNPGDKVLDIGCGTGSYDAFLYGYYCEVVGIDISRGQLTRAKERARKRNQKIDFIVADMNHLPIRDDYFDHVLCLDAIRDGDIENDTKFPTYGPSIGRIVREFKRVINKDRGGLIIGAIYRVPNFYSNFYKTLMEKAREFYEKSKDSGFSDGEFNHKALKPMELKYYVALLYSLKV